MELDKRTKRKEAVKVTLGDALRNNPKTEERFVRAGYEKYQEAVKAQECKRESSSRDLDNAAKEAASYLCAKSRGRVIMAFKGACFRKCQNRPEGCESCFRFSNYLAKENPYDEDTEHFQSAAVEAGV